MNPGPAPAATRRLRWALRLRHPAVALTIPAALAAAGALALPVFFPAAGHRTPVFSLRPPPQFRLLPAPVFAAPPTPPLAPVAPVSAPAFPPAAVGPTRPPTAVAPAPAALSCRVVRSGAAPEGNGEWAVEVALEDGGRDGRGEVLLPAGASASGRVRLDHAGTPTTWPNTWRLWLPEEGGASREIELSASFLPQTGGIHAGAVGRLVVRGWSRIGDRRGDLTTTAALGTPVGEPAVQVLTGRGAAGKPGRDQHPFELPLP